MRWGVLILCLVMLACGSKKEGDTFGGATTGSQKPGQGGNPGGGGSKKPASKDLMTCKFGFYEELGPKFYELQQSEKEIIYAHAENELIRGRFTVDSEISTATVTYGIEKRATGNGFIKNVSLSVLHTHKGSSKWSQTAQLGRLGMGWNKIEFYIGRKKINNYYVDRFAVICGLFPN